MGDRQIIRIEAVDGVVMAIGISEGMTNKDAVRLMSEAIGIIVPDVAILRQKLVNDPDLKAKVLAAHAEIVDEELGRMASGE